MDFQDRLYQKQAERISAQHEEIGHLRQEIDRLLVKLGRTNAAATFYLALVEAIGDDVMLQDEWRRFIAILRLAKPDLPGLTCADPGHQFLGHIK